MDERIKVVDTLAEVLEDLDNRGIQGVQRYRAMNQYLSLKARYDDVPLSGTFELTPLCNLDCKMCYVHLNAEQLPTGQGLLGADAWKDIIRQAVDAGMIYAAFTGGECLTYPAFREIYLYAYSLGIRPDLMTNGCLLTEEMVSFLAQYPPGVMQISLYGSSEDAYEAVTGHRAFHKAISGIERAKTAGLNVTIAITPNRFMQPDIEPLLELLHSLHLPYEIGSATLPARPETNRSIDNYAVEIDAHDRLISLDNAYQANDSSGAPLSMIPRYLPSKQKTLRGLPCGGAHSSFHINWEGEMCPCIAFAQSVHCDVRHQGFASAWREVRQQMEAYQPPKECCECEMQSVCMTCPGEKGMGEISGRLNSHVCDRLRRRIAKGRAFEGESGITDLTPC